MQMAGLNATERKLGREGSKCALTVLVLHFVPSGGGGTGCASHWGPGGGDAAEVGLFQAMWFPPELVTPTQMAFSIETHATECRHPHFHCPWRKSGGGGGFLSCILL